ncbi:hypothetical protein ACFL4Y_01580 [Gemmatimonadota bacterium]
MKFSELLSLASDLPAFSSSLLIAGDVSAAYVRRQLSEWVSTGRVIRLRKGLYAPAPEYRKYEPDRFVVANLIRSGSYVSLQSALGFEGLIPEVVPAVTSVWTGRPGEVVNPLGRFIYRHLSAHMLFGYRTLGMGHEQEALMATPEKALLDLVHLTPAADDVGYLRELRLQNLEVLSATKLEQFARRTERPKLERAASIVSEWIALGDVPE